MKERDSFEIGARCCKASVPEREKKTLQKNALEKVRDFAKGPMQLCKGKLVGDLIWSNFEFSYHQYLFEFLGFSL